MSDLRPVYRPGAVQWTLNPHTGLRDYGPPTPLAWARPVRSAQPSQIGAIAASPGDDGSLALPDARAETSALEGFQAAARRITPTLMPVGIATGAAFAIGSGLVHRYVFGGK